MENKFLKKIMEKDSDLSLMEVVKQASAGNFTQMDKQPPQINPEVQKEGILPKAINTAVNGAMITSMMPQAFKTKAINILKSGMGKMKNIPKV